MGRYMYSPALQAFPGGPEILIILLMVLIIVAIIFVAYRVIQGAAILSDQRREND